MLHNIAVFCASRLGNNPAYEEAARQLGTHIAQQGITLTYGGSNLGYMGIVSSAALQAGGKVVGIIPKLFSPEVIYSQPGTEVVLVDSLAERKEQMIAQCDAFVALPGGVGTLDEISEVLAANQLKICRKPMGLLNIDSYFDALLQQINRMRQDGLLRNDCCLFATPTVEELMESLKCRTC